MRIPYLVSYVHILCFTDYASFNIFLVDFPDFSWDSILNIVLKTKIKSSLVHFRSDLSPGDKDNLEALLFALESNSYFYIGVCNNSAVVVGGRGCSWKYVVTLDQRTGFAMEKVKMENGIIEEDFNLQVID